MKKPIYQLMPTLILLMLLSAIAAHSQTPSTEQKENTAGTIQTIPCASITDESKRQVCELASMLNKTLTEKRAALDLAQKRLEEIEALKDLSEEQKKLAADLRNVITELKGVISSYVQLVELLMKRPPKKCFISVFNC